MEKGTRGGFPGKSCTYTELYVYKEFSIKIRNSFNKIDEFYLSLRLMLKSFYISFTIFLCEVNAYITTIFLWCLEKKFCVSN